MAWQEDRDQRTEKGTPRRREEARKKGQVTRSRDVISVAVLMAGAVVFYLFGHSLFISLEGLMKGLLMQSTRLELTPVNLSSMMIELFSQVSFLMFPFILLPIAGLAASAAQVGFMFTAEPVTPQFSRINPIEGLKRIISPTALAELIKGLLKVLIIAYAANRVLGSEIAGLASMPDMDVVNISYYGGAILFKVLMTTGMVLTIIAVLDYAFQRWEFEKSVRMTKFELKEEFKESEGHPALKSRIRSLQRDMARQRMMEEVPKATVVIVNPTHIAVAVRYEQDKMKAPLVVAKGAGFIAEKIRDIARRNGIPIIENKPLARSLFKSVKIGKEIPVSLYKAIAEILAYIYRLKRGGKAANG